MAGFWCFTNVTVSTFTNHYCFCGRLTMWL